MALFYYLKTVFVGIKIFEEFLGILLEVQMELIRLRIIRPSNLKKKKHTVTARIVRLKEFNCYAIKVLLINV